MRETEKIESAGKGLPGGGGLVFGTATTVGAGAVSEARAAGLQPQTRDHMILCVWDIMLSVPNTARSR